MLKRLSYPLSWVGVDNVSSDGKQETESAPNTSDSNQSVFSKVFSRYLCKIFHIKFCQIFFSNKKFERTFKTTHKNQDGFLRISIINFVNIIFHIIITYCYRILNKNIKYVR